MLKLKSLTLQSPIIQSPMAGCTDLAFRLIAREHGMEFAFLEMVSADALVRDNKKTRELLKSTPEDRPLGAQLVGCDPEIMGQAAAIIEEMGFDLVDINCGCPVPKITSPGGGSALLIEPEKSKKIFQSVVKNVKKIPVTVKMRKGYADPSGDEAVTLARHAEDAGASAVTIHGRTRSQGYSGSADWEAIGKVKRAVKIPVFGNGDIIDAGRAKQMIETSGADGVMIGRGGLGNPWIYKAIEAELVSSSFPHAVRRESDPHLKPSLDQIKQTALKHLDLEIQFEGERLAVLKFRKIACWYFKNLPGVAEFRGKINVAQTAEEMRELILNFALNIV